MSEFNRERSTRPDQKAAAWTITELSPSNAVPGKTPDAKLISESVGRTGRSTILSLSDPGEPLAAKMLRPARTIRNRGARQNLLGKFPSEKMDRMVRYESSLERDYLLWLEFDPAIVGMVEQPFKIKYRYNGKKRVYTPDFLVNHINGISSIVEVKPTSKLACKKLQLKLRLVADIIEEFGYSFRVVTEQNIRREPQLRNIGLLRRYSRTSVSDHQYFTCKALLQQHSRLTISDVCDSLYATGLNIAGVYALIYKGALWTDLDVIIADKSIVSLTCPSNLSTSNIN